MRASRKASLAIYALLALPLTGCMTTTQQSPSPEKKAALAVDDTQNVQPIKTAVTSPTTYCGRILIGGELDEHIKKINYPVDCKMADDTFVKFTAAGWTGDSRREGTATAGPIAMTIELLDLPTSMELPKLDPQLGDHGKHHAELILPNLIAHYSSETIKIDHILKSTGYAPGITWVEVAAFIYSSPSHVMQVIISRAIDTVGGDTAVLTEARNIIEHDLPQISAKP